MWREKMGVAYIFTSVSGGDLGNSIIDTHPQCKVFVLGMGVCLCPYESKVCVCLKLLIL